MRYIFLAFLFSFMFFSCYYARQTSNGQQASSSIIGEWRNTYLKVIMHSYKNSDTIRIVEANENNWEEVLKSKTIRTFFRSDGTYNSEYRNLKDSIFYSPAGKWSVSGDSLFMTDTFPSREVMYKLKFEIKGNMAEFWSTLDFDQDGKEDDDYYGIQKKQ